MLSSKHLTIKAKALLVWLAVLILGGLATNGWQVLRLAARTVQIETQAFLSTLSATVILAYVASAILLWLIWQRPSSRLAKSLIGCVFCAVLVGGYLTKRADYAIFDLSADTWYHLAVIRRVATFGLHASPYYPDVGYDFSLYHIVLGLISKQGVDPILLWRNLLWVSTPLMLASFFLLSFRIVQETRTAFLSMILAGIGFGFGWAGSITPGFGIQFSNYPWQIAISFLFLTMFFVLSRGENSHRDTYLASICAALVLCSHIAVGILLAESLAAYLLAFGDIRRVLKVVCGAIALSSPWLLVYFSLTIPRYLQVSRAPSYPLYDIGGLSFWLLRSDFLLLALSFLGILLYSFWFFKDRITTARLYCLISFLAVGTTILVPPIAGLMIILMGNVVLLRSSVLMLCPILSAELLTCGSDRVLSFLEGRGIGARTKTVSGLLHRSVRPGLTLIFLLIIMVSQLAPKIHFYSLTGSDLEEAQSLGLDISKFREQISGSVVLSDPTTSVLLSYFSDATSPLLVHAEGTVRSEGNLKSILSQFSDAEQTFSALVQLNCSFVFVNLRSNNTAIRSWYEGRTEIKFKSSPKFSLLYEKNDVYLFRIGAT